MLESEIKSFHRQLEYEPVIENSAAFNARGSFIVCGMGGSNLAAGIIESWKPKLDVIIHRDFGLSEIDAARLNDYLIIASSYSGNTQETLDAFNEALARKLPLIAITTGGKLLELAKENGAPFIQMPKIDDNPRFAIGYSIKATLKAMGEESLINDINGIVLDAEHCRQEAESLADAIKDKIPLIYSSGRNTGLGRYWKISFNETAKLPAFYNFMPELNHNEMIGFSSKIFDGRLNHKFAFIFLNDPDDELRVQQRIFMTQKVFKDRGFVVATSDVIGPSLWHKSFASILKAMWTSYYLAKHYGVDPEDISMIEDLKRLAK